MVLQLKKIKMENALRVFMQMVCGMAVFWKKTATEKLSLKANMNMDEE